MDPKLTFSALSEFVQGASHHVVDTLGDFLVPVLTLVTVLLCLAVKQSSFPNPPELKHVGHSGPLSYWFSALQYAYNPAAVLDKVNRLGYSACKIPTISGWIVIGVKSMTIEALKKVPEYQSLPTPNSRTPASFFLDQLEWIFGSLYHDEDVVEEFRETMTNLVALTTRNIDASMPLLRNEIIATLKAFEREQAGNGAPGFSQADVCLSILSRVLDIGLFGQELASHPNFIRIRAASNYVIRAYDLWKPLGSITHRLFLIFYSRSMRNIILKLGSYGTKQRKDAAMIGYLRTLFDEDSKAFSMKSQLMTSRCLLTLRIWALQKLCHNTSQVIYRVSALSRLDSSYLNELKDEVDLATRRHGWSADALVHMPLVDSLVKESMRLGNLDGYSFYRIFPHRSRFEGIRGNIPGRIPVTVPIRLVHLDPHRYPSPHVMIPNRFMGLRDLGTLDVFTTPPPNPKHRLETTNPDFLAWGYGVHACPGRFFAGSVMKLIAAVLIEGWDVECVDDTRSAGSWTEGRKCGKLITLRKREI